jgi:hypothetical protein
MIVLGVDCTGRGHLSSVLKEEVREPEVIGKKSVPGPLSAQPGLYWGHTEAMAAMAVGRLQEGLPVCDSEDRVSRLHDNFLIMSNEDFLMSSTLGRVKSLVWKKVG